jgi:hypothetical protein
MPKYEATPVVRSLALECRRPISSTGYFAPYPWQSRGTIRHNILMAMLCAGNGTAEETAEDRKDRDEGYKED